MDHLLLGWDINERTVHDWLPWGSQGLARAKVLATADGFNVVIVVAEPGYQGDPHDHPFPEFLYVLQGKVHVQGRCLHRGGAYAASAGTRHTDFGTDVGATYLTIFKL